MASRCDSDEKISHTIELKRKMVYRHLFSAHLESSTLISRRDMGFHVVAYLPIRNVVLLAVPLSPGMNLVDDWL
jgi:hypothetical protein